MENENVVVDTTETTTEDVALETTEAEETSQENSDESVDELRTRLAKAEKKAQDQQKRAEIAEKKVKEPVEKTLEQGLSLKEWRALQDIHEDDVEEVVAFAKFKKISISDAKKSPIIKNLLKDNEEQRKVAVATNTGNAKRGSVKVSDEEVVEKSNRGQLPEDPESLAKARWNLKKKK